MHIRVISRFVVFAALLPALLAAATAAEQCSFRHRPFESGETSNQTVRCDLQLEMAIRQGETTINTTNQTVRREQQRQIRIVEMGAKAPVKAIVTYSSIYMRNIYKSSKMQCIDGS